MGGPWTPPVGPRHPSPLRRHGPPLVLALAMTAVALLLASRGAVLLAALMVIATGLLLRGRWGRRPAIDVHGPLPALTSSMRLEETRRKPVSFGGFVTHGGDYVHPALTSTARRGAGSAVDDGAGGLMLRYPCVEGDSGFGLELVHAGVALETVDAAAVRDLAEAPVADVRVEDWTRVVRCLGDRRDDPAATLGALPDRIALPRGHECHAVTLRDVHLRADGSASVTVDVWRGGTGFYE